MRPDSHALTGRLFVTGTPTFADYSAGCGYWNAYSSWNGLMTSGKGPVYTTSNGTIYLLSTCEADNNNPLYRGSYLTVLNPDGSLRYNKLIGGMDLSRILVPYFQMGNAVDEARDTAYIPGVNGGQNNPYTGVIHRVKLSTGAIVSSWPTTKYGSVFSYDYFAGNLYFVYGATGTYPTLGAGSYLNRVNPDTGAQTTVAMDAPVNFSSAGMGMVAWKGVVYAVEAPYLASRTSTVYRIDTNVLPAHVEVLSRTTGTGPGTITKGPPGHGTVRQHRARTPLNIYTG